MKTFLFLSLFLVLFIWPACISNAYAQTALEYYNKGEKLKSEGSFKAAIEQYQLAGSLWEKEGQLEGQSVAVNSIGSMYQMLKQYNKANRFYQKALHLAEKCGNKNNVAVYTNNIGLIYQIKGDYKNALQYLHKALNMTVALKANNEDSLILLSLQYRNRL
jgi:tetratricopeptide (TPR) repeat protein